MSEGNTKVEGWNIFARELATILHARGMRLGHLNDRAGIHPERVRRLQQSLREPRFHVLPPEDLEHVAHVFGLSDDERVRLRAAILVTAIESILMQRIAHVDALAAAEAIFPILCRALRDCGDESDGIGAIKMGPGDTLGTPEADAQLEAALAHLDAALLGLHLGQSLPADGRRACLLDARDQLRAAAEKLDAMPTQARAHELWLAWHADVLQALAATERATADAGLQARD